MKTAKHPFDRRLLALCLVGYPRRFRELFTDELLAVYDQRRLSASQSHWPVWSVVWLALKTLGDTLRGMPLTWLDEWRRSELEPHRRETSVTNLLRETVSIAQVLFTRQRSFTALCVLTLAFGLGAATAIFTVVHGVLLAPLPYGEPERVLLLHQGSPDKGWHQFFSGPNFTDLRDRLQSFEVLAAYDDYRPEGMDLTGTDRVERLRILQVGSGYFEALGVAPLLGRTFQRDEEIPAGAASRDQESFAVVTTPAQTSVILSHDFWLRRFGSQDSGARDVIGSTLELDQQRYSIVGVMPAGLGGHVGGTPDVWLPLDLAAGGGNVHGNQYLNAVGRLQPGVGIEEAQAELDRATIWLQEEHPKYNGHVQLGAVPLPEAVLGPSRSMLGLLLAAVGAMLAIACINVANLFLARGLGRNREFGVRSALGANRQRLFAAALIESLWVGVAGGVLGLGFAWVAVRWLHRLRPAALPRYDALGLHLPVFAFSVLAVLATVLIFGLWPALRAARVGSQPGGSRGAATSGRRERRIRDLGVSLQIAFSLMLLAAGGLLVRSFQTLHEVDMGFDASRALTFQLRLPDYAYGEPERRVEFYDQLFTRLGRLPDLAASGATSKLPGNGHRNHWGFAIEGYEKGEGRAFPGAEVRCVAGQALEALSIPLLTGRTLKPEDDLGAAPVVLVNRSLVEAFLPDRDPIGVRVQVGDLPPQTIVGVVADTRHDPREAAVPKIYLPQPQFAEDRNWDLSFVVSRSAGSKVPWASIRSQVEAAVAEIDPQLVVYDVRTLTEIAAQPIARQRFSAQLMIIFASFSLLLAAVGLFGALAYSLKQRHAEIGVRMALGADRRAILMSVMAQGLRIFVVGAALGLGGIFAVGRWLESLLYGIQPTDPGSLLAALGVLLVVAMGAAIEPARRVSKLDSAKILRES